MRRRISFSLRLILRRILSSPMTGSLQRTNQPTEGVVAVQSVAAQSQPQAKGGNAAETRRTASSKVCEEGEESTMRGTRLLRLEPMSSEGEWNEGRGQHRNGTFET